MDQLYGIANFVLVTLDLARLVAFYRDTLGLPPIGPEETIASSEMALLGLTGTGRRQRFVVGGQQLAIDQYATPGRAYSDDGDAASLWFQHFALCVTDIDAAYARLSDFSSISIHGPERLPAKTGGVQAFKFRDPDGHPLEFLEKTNRSSSGAGHITGIDHSAISVRDADASASFYSDLGLKSGVRTLNQGVEQERLDALPSVQVDVVPMIPPLPTPHLELLGYRTPRGRPGSAREVADVAATRIVWHGSRTGLFRDPDGHLHQVEPG